MPLRDYRCKNAECNHVEDFLEPIESPEERECPKCKQTMKRIMTSPASFKVVVKPKDYSATQRQNSWNSGRPL